MKKKIQKPFDAEDAKNGARVETKSGKSVRIICYDVAGTNFPIIALTNLGGNECCSFYTFKGETCDNEFDNYNDNDDLVIVEEVECPKFKEGDWVFLTNGKYYPWLITTATPDYYELQDAQGRKVSASQISIDESYRLWTINDAKPGDVLTCGNDNRPFIFKELSYGAPIAYCGIDIAHSIVIDTSRRWTNNSVKPATYEEKEMLFKKMEEEGYKWDADSLTLSKIQKRWRDNKKITISGYFIEEPDIIDKDREYVNSYITYSEGHSNTKENYNLFATKKQAKSALAMARISQIMANDERFGGVVTDEEWDGRTWYNIVRIRRLLIVEARSTYDFLAFHTKEQAELFVDENRDLVKDYYMLG